MSITAENEYAAACKKFEERMLSQVAPPDSSDIIDWWEANVTSIPYSPNNGPFRREYAPWIIEPARAAVDPETRLVMMLACIQASKSQLLELLTAHIIAREPGPTLALQDNDLNSKDWSETRLHVLWQSIGAVREKVGEGKLTPHSMQFAHMPFWSLGAFNERNLQRRSIRWLLGDEWWLWPKGHIAEAMGRLTAFKELGKAVLASQGSVEGDEGHELWKTTTQEEYGFNCPSCNGPNIFRDSGIRFPREAKLSDEGWHIPTLRAGVRFGCTHCDASWADTNESRALLNSDEHRRYIVTNPEAGVRKRGFRWRAPAVRSWADIAEAIVRSKKLYAETGDDTQRRIYRQKQEADFWMEEADTGAFAPPVGQYRMSDAWADEAGLNEYGEVVQMTHGLIPLRIVTIDCQRDGFWVMCRSWSRDGRSRLRGWANLRTRVDVEAFVANHGVNEQFVFADAGDSDDEFWIWLAARKWRALRGDQKKDFAWKVATSSGRIDTVYRPISPEGRYGASTVHRVPVFFFSNLVLKDMLSRLRKRGKWAEAVDAGEELTQQMESERRVKNTRGENEWQQIGKRANHLFDCAVMQLFVLISLDIVGQEAEEGEQETPMQPTPENNE